MAASGPMSETASAGPAYHRRGDLLWRELDGEVVLLDLRSSTYFTLNHTGTLLWQRLGEPADASELIAALVEAYGVSDGEAAADVVTFLATLEDRGFLERE
jgi:hypothetical protein